MPLQAQPKRALAWDQETGGKKAQRKVFFLVFPFQTPKEKRRALAKSVESESKCCHEGIVLRRGKLRSGFAEAQKSMPSKDKKGVVPRSVEYREPGHQGLDLGIPQNHIDQEGVWKRERRRKSGRRSALHGRAELVG